MSVNVAIVTRKSKAKDTSRAMVSYLNYCHRSEEYFSRYSSEEDVNDASFARLYGGKEFYHLIISPAFSTSMDKLLEKTIEGIAKFNHLSPSSLHYIAYEHRDTEHAHFHIVIPLTSRRIELSINFVMNYLHPYLNSYLGRERVPLSMEEEKKRYRESTHSTGAECVDFDIKRQCIKVPSDSSLSHGQKSPNTYDFFYVYSKEKEEKNIKAKRLDEWKVPYIEERLKVLSSDGVCRKINGKTVLLQDFIYRKILYGKLLSFRDVMKKEGIEKEKVSSRTVSKDDTLLLLGEIKRRGITSRLVKAKSGEICFYTQKEHGERK